MRQSSPAQRAVAHRANRERAIADGGLRELELLRQRDEARAVACALIGLVPGGADMLITAMIESWSQE